MTVMHAAIIRGLSTTMLFFCIVGTVTGGVTQPQEYAKYVGRSSMVEAFADFGDQVNLRDGSLLLRTTDIVLPGTGPTIRLTRTFNPDGLGQYFHETSGNGFGAWELEIPRIRTITSSTTGASIYSPVNWQVVGANTKQKNARCTAFSAPSRISFPSDSARGWEPYEWWNGYHFTNDDGEDQAVMTRANNAVRPDIPLMTSGNWLVGCLTATTNGEPGEAFYALAPDGTKYWFNYLVYTDADELQKPLFSEWAKITSSTLTRSPTNKTSSPTGPTPKLVAEFDYITRRYAAMLVTRIEDRFGNWVTYRYTAGKLDSIDASDGRHVGITYPSVGNTTVTVGSGPTAKTWTYTYTTNLGDALQQLTVTRPDGSRWRYTLNWQVAAAMSVDELETSATCPNDTVPYGEHVDQTIVSPSGATLAIRVTRRMFGRSYVPKNCFNAKPNIPYSGIMMYPKDWYAYAVTSRTVSGPGVATATWTYAYAPPTSSWLQDCPTHTSCNSTVWTDVTSPDGIRRRSIFSNKFDETENKLLREEVYTATNQLLRTKDYTYATVARTNWGSNPYPWPISVGNDQQTRQNPQTSGQWAPIRQVTTTQQGRTFTWEVPSTCGSGSSICFDVYARPTKVVTSSSP